MEKVLTKIISNHFRDIADKLDDGTCKLSMTQAEHIINMITHIPLSKEEACKEFKLSRATFDRYVVCGYIPKGIKETGKKELVWFKDEIEQGLKRLKR